MSSWMGKMSMWKKNWTRLCFRKLCIAKMGFIILHLLCWEVWFAFIFHVQFSNIFCVQIISKHWILLVQCCAFYWETCKLFPLKVIALLNMTDIYFECRQNWSFKTSFTLIVCILAVERLRLFSFSRYEKKLSENCDGKTMLTNENIAQSC